MHKHIVLLLIPKSREKTLFEINTERGSIENAILFELIHYFLSSYICGNNALLVRFFVWNSYWKISKLWQFMKIFRIKHQENKPMPRDENTDSDVMSFAHGQWILGWNGRYLYYGHWYPFRISPAYGGRWWRKQEGSNSQNPVNCDDMTRIFIKFALL